MVLHWDAQFRQEDVPLPDGFEEIDSIVERRESDPAGRVRIRAARQRLAERLGEQIEGIAVLRLRKGMSQKQLADAIGTSQPHIARIENGRENVLLATANELARALDASLEEVNRALGYPRSAT